MKNSQSAIVRLFQYAKPYRANIYWASLFSILNKLFDIMPEVLIGVAVDTVVKRHDSWLARFGIYSLTKQLLFLGGLTFIIWIFESLFEYLYSVRWRNLAQVMQHKLRMDAYTHIQNADMSYFEHSSTGNLVSILNDDINQLERFLDNGANTIIQVISSSILIGAIFFFLAPKVAVFALIPIPIIIFGSYYFQNLITPRYAAVRAKAGELSTRFANNITGIATIKSYTAENYEIVSLEKQSSEYQMASSRAIALSSGINPVIRIAVLIGFLATLVYGGLLSIHGQLAIGAYSILIFLTQRLLWPLTDLSEITDQYYRAMASTDRVLNLLKTPINIFSNRYARRLPKIQGDIAIENLSFAYYPNQWILQNIDLEIKAGSTIAFVGSTGSGKSSLVKLLLRFYDPTQGSIKIDGKDLRDYDLQDLRQRIGYVSQDIFLFDGSIAENISYGSFGASEAAIKAAAELAEADEFIMRLPQNYQTRIGERGQRLSGGQRQRIGLARAILKNPPILILDEATSAVDNETEAAIQRSLEKIIVDRTTIMIAHRLSTIRHADIICVLADGKIVERGQHESLLTQNGVYASLWALQTGAKMENCV
jgi:ATP-binding cassette subfamily B protein